MYQRIPKILKQFNGQKMKAKIIPKWSQHGGPREPTWTQNGIRKSMCFWMFFWVPPETLNFPRRGVDGASTGRRVVHFLQPSPQGGAILSKNIVE